MYDIGFYCICDDKYQEYIPLFIYFVSESYPGSYIEIDLTNKLNKNVDKDISLLDGHGYNFKINESQFNDSNKNNPDVLKTLRWITHKKSFDQCRYLWIGDIDMYICKEFPSLLSQHMKHMDFLNVPYSNFLRPKPPLRMSGIHIIKCEQWFNAIDEHIPTYHNMINNINKEQCNVIGVNEQVLYKLICETFGDPEKLHYAYDNHYSYDTYNTFIESQFHGIHIRAIEHRGKIGLTEGRNYKKYMSELSKLMTNNLFDQLITNNTKMQYVFNQIKSCLKSENINV